jgi:hypothetical protein
MIRGHFLPTERLPASGLTITFVCIPDILFPHKPGLLVEPVADRKFIFAAGWLDFILSAAPCQHYVYK